MKFALFTLLALGSLMASAQSKDSLLANFKHDDRGNYYLQNVVEIEGKTKDEIMAKVGLKATAILSGKKSKTTILGDNFLGTGWCKNERYEKPFHFDLEIEVKDGRYRYTLSNITWKPRKTGYGNSMDLNRLVVRGFKDDYYHSARKGVASIIEDILSIPELFAFENAGAKESW
jgi:hypothetical protein